MKKYWQILKKYQISLLACPLLVLVSVMCETVQPMYMADIIDNGVMQRDLSVITAVGGKMILISIVGLILALPMSTYLPMHPLVSEPICAPAFSARYSNSLSSTSTGSVRLRLLPA